jgi:hypothetical protein
MVDETTYFAIRLRFSTPESIAVWKERVLLAQREYLELVPGFADMDRLDHGDTLLDKKMIVPDVSTLEEALTSLKRDGHPVERDRIIEWSMVWDDDPAVRLATGVHMVLGVYLVLAGPLPQSATVGDLLAHLQRPGIEHGFVEVLTRDATAVVIHGFLPDYHAYRDYRLPMIYAGVAASRLGAEGTVSFLGSTDDNDYVTTFADFQDGTTQMSEPDPQDLGAQRLEERFGGSDFEAVHRAWKAR